jgi:hypothetical protein
MLAYFQIDIAMRDNAKNLYSKQLKSIGRGNAETHFFCRHAPLQGLL